MLASLGLQERDYTIMPFKTVKKRFLQPDTSLDWVMSTPPLFPPATV
jgi:hypothetical protein